jgi:hypothetical protein
MPHTHRDLQTAPLAVLFHRINQHQDILCGYSRNALRVALDQGDVLAWAKARTPARQWKGRLQENCPKVAERTDVLHRRLAAHRSIIESALANNPDLKVRDAIALISTRKPKVNKTKVVAQKVASTETPVSIKTTTPTINVRPAIPLNDSNRTTVINLALEALNVSRRPTSTPNKEIIQELLGQIIVVAKTVTTPAKPPALDETLFPKAMGLAA